MATLTANLMLFATAQISILKESLKNLGESNNDENQSATSFEEDENSDISYKHLCECVEHHNSIIR